MMPNIVLVSALLFGILHGPHAQSVTKTYAEGGWILKVSYDTFTHQTTCQIANRNDYHPEVTVSPEAVAFHFNPTLDTYGAWYKVDQGAPHAWQDQSPALIHAGLMAKAEGLESATGGVVVIPMGQLSGASVVEVRPTLRSPSKAFRLALLWKMIASANGLGCKFQNAPNSPS